LKEKGKKILLMFKIYFTNILMLRFACHMSSSYELMLNLLAEWNRTIGAPSEKGQYVRKVEAN
jgi:hypothetical protein